jgi:hypothetical protein
MARRHQVVFLLAVVWTTGGATYPTQNFVVEAPTPQIAEQVGKAAEYYRREKALQWLGREMPTWPERCSLSVRVTMSSPGGATSFNFMNGHVWQQMNIEGPLDRILASVLPHEVTHTVFAHYFRQPVPRWADEGGSVLSEDDLERSRHDSMVRVILNSGRAIRLRTLFSLRDYPREVGALYAEGYSVSDFLVGTSNRQTFLSFVAHGMQYGWDSASQSHYHYQSVEQLEQAWIEHLRTGRRAPPVQVVQGNGPVQADPARRVVVRLTAPPVQPLDDGPTAPVFRGQAPEYDQVGGWSDTRQPAGNRPGYLPDYRPGPQGWQPGAGMPPAGQSPPVRLGTPQFDPVPGQGSPVGYPYR